MLARKILISLNSFFVKSQENDLQILLFVKVSYFYFLFVKKVSHKLSKIQSDVISCYHFSIITK